MYVRLAFAVAVHVDPDVLLVDEVLAVGDEPFQRKCLERIRTFQNEGRTIILISHGLDQVAQFCDRAVVLEHGQVAADGAPEDALMVLRADFETARQEELARQATAAGPDDAPHARFNGVSVTSASGVTGRPTILKGESVSIAMEIESDTDLYDWTIELGITTLLGNMLFSTTTEMLGVALEPLRGVRRFQFRFPALTRGYRRLLRTHNDSLQLGCGTASRPSRRPVLSPHRQHDPRSRLHSQLLPVVVTDRGSHLDEAYDRGAVLTVGHLCTTQRIVAPSPALAFACAVLALWAFHRRQESDAARQE